MKGVFALLGIFICLMSVSSGSKDHHSKKKKGHCEARTLSGEQASCCARELESILYRPQVCDREFFAEMSAKFAQQAGISGSVFSPWFCAEFLAQTGTVLEVLDQNGAPLCLSAQITDQDTTWGIYSASALQINLNFPVPRNDMYVYFYSMINAGAQPPANLFNPSSVNNDMQGLTQFMAYLGDSTTMNELTYRLTQFAIAIETQHGDTKQVQFDINFYFQVVVYLSLVPLDQIYERVYVPILAWYGVSMPPEDASSLLTATWFLGRLYTALNGAPYGTDPELRQGQYAQILRFILSPAGYVYDFGLLEPVTFLNAQMCMHGFTYMPGGSSIYRVVMSRPQAS